MDKALRKRPPVKGQGVARRRFLQGALSTGAFLAARRGLAQDAATPAEPQTPPETILVVGAGLAGLAVAQRLREGGKRVILIEASAIPGGRVRTLRGHFDAGLYAELGAGRIAETHEYVLHWLSDLNLSLAPFSPETGSAMLVLNGRRVRVDDPQLREKLTPDLNPDERDLSPPALLGKYLEGVPADLAMPELDLTEARWAAYDRLTWPAWLASRGASKSAIAFMTLGGDSAPLSALYILRQIMLHRDSRQYFKIEGGMDSLPRAIAAGLSDSIRYNCELVQIGQNSTGVRATVRVNGANETIGADKAVLAVPFSMLRTIPITPALSPEKARAVAGLSYREATRFLLQTRTRFWEAEKLTGGARSDAPADIWDMSYGQEGTSGLLSVTTGGTEVERRIAALPQAGRVRYGLDLAAGPFPEARAQLQKSYVQRWVDEPYARGAFAVLLPGQTQAWGPAIGAPEGRIHFAGEHLSPHSGWMEGALWSAERVAQEILQPQ